MRIYTGRSPLLMPALIDTLRRAMDGDYESHIIVVPKQLTLQTERTLLKALNLRGSFALQITSPERLCGRIFEAAGQPEGVRVDERGRVMLVRAAIRQVDDRLKLYRGADHRRGFPDRCARQLELIRQAGLTPERLLHCAEETDGLLAMKLTDLALIQEAYEGLLEGRFQDGESEFNAAVVRAKDADFLRRADVYFYGFDLTPPTLHGLMAAVGAACPDTHVFLPLENDENARDFDVFLPLKASFDRLWLASRQAGVWPERVRVAADGECPAKGPAQAPELAHLAGELFAFPARSWERPPRRVQMATLRNPLEECRFAAALCRRMAMKFGWRWNEMQILCRDLESYRQPLQEAFRAYGVPLFTSSSRAASRHALAECLISALRLIGESPRMEDALSLMRCGFMPLTRDEADRLANYAQKYGLRPKALLRPLRRGIEAELTELEPVRAAFAQPVNRLRERVRRAEDLRTQLSALFEFLTDIEAPDRLQNRLNQLIEADLREAAGEESQVWNRLIGALDQMAELMGEAPLSVDELRETLSESLEAAVIKPLPQSDDAVYAQTTDRILAQPVKALLILGESDRAGVDTDGLLSASQLQTFSRLAHAYLGSDDAELSRMRRFYLKAALGMATDYLCVTCPLSDADNAAQRPGTLMSLVQGLFPALAVRGGIAEDDSLQWMLRAAPEAAVGHVARALSEQGEGVPAPSFDRAALAGLTRLSVVDPSLRLSLSRVRAALNHVSGARQLNPETAKGLYGALKRQSVTRLERFAACPFAYFAQYGLRPLRIEPFELNVRDEGTFFHDAVHEFLLASMEDLNRLDDRAAGQRMDLIADRLLDAMAATGPLGDTAVALAERRRLKATARTCAGVLAAHMRESRFNPAALETDFGVEDGAARLIVNAASGACTLEGRIDRIDAWAEGGYIRVIDYKRGGRDLALDALYYGLSMQLPVYLAAALKRRDARSAGVYYFNLDEGIVTLQSTDPHEVEKQRRERFRLTGLAPDDPQVLTALSPAFPQVMKLRVNRDGTLSKDALATDETGFRVLMERTLTMAGQHLDAIRGGEASVSPARFRQQDPCKNCAWREICLFDERLDAGCVRRFRTIKPDKVIEMLKLAQAEGSGKDAER